MVQNVEFDAHRAARAFELGAAVHEDAVARGEFAGEAAAPEPGRLEHAAGVAQVRADHGHATAEFVHALDPAERDLFARLGLAGRARALHGA